MDTKIKVLIVEDDIDLSTMYKLKFEKEGFDVKVANNGLIAATMIADFSPNIILLDIMMPDMDGFETLRVMKQLAPSLDCKIIMFSNLNSKEDIDKCMSSGADAYLLKANTTPKEAVEKIYELLGIQKNVTNNNIDTKHSELIQKTCPHCGQSIHLDIKIS